MTSRQNKEVDTELSDAERTQNEDIERANSIKEKNKPLVHNIYTADPSAHVFEGKIYIYPSHDIETDAETNDNGDQFAMRDYHVLSMDHPQSETIDHGVALAIEDIPWAKNSYGHLMQLIKMESIIYIFLQEITTTYFVLVWQ